MQSVIPLGISVFDSDGLFLVHPATGRQHTQAVSHRDSPRRTTIRRRLPTHSTRYPRRVEQSHHLTFALTLHSCLSCRFSRMVDTSCFWWRIDCHSVWEHPDRFDWKDKWSIWRVRTCCGFCVIQCTYDDCWRWELDGRDVVVAV